MLGLGAMYVRFGYIKLGLGAMLGVRIYNVGSGS